MGPHFRVEAIPEMILETHPAEMDRIRAHMADDRFRKLKTFVLGDQNCSIRDGLTTGFWTTANSADFAQVGNRFPVLVYRHWHGSYSRAF